MVCFLKFSNNSKPLIILTPGTVSGGSIKRFPKNKFKDFLGGPRRILYSYPSALFFISTIMPVVNATTTPATRSSFCSRNANKTFSVGDEGFEARCSMERSEWTFVTSKSYSALTEFGLVCDRTWLSALVGSSYHIGGFLGINFHHIILEDFYVFLQIPLSEEMMKYKTDLISFLYVLSKLL